MKKETYEKIIEVLTKEIEKRDADIYLLKLRIEELKKESDNNG